MKKDSRTTALVESLGLQFVPREDSAGIPLDSRYLGYFQCFNEQRYYEAHDVLESLWLEQRAASRDTDPNCAFFKGLIQVAGAYVHLQKQFRRPDHPKDGRRLHPAARLLVLAMKNLTPYQPVYLSLDVRALHTFCAAQADSIVGSDYLVNPWRPENAPSLSLL